MKELIFETLIKSIIQIVIYLIVLIPVIGINLYYYDKIIQKRKQEKEKIKKIKKEENKKQKEVKRTEEKNNSLQKQITVELLGDFRSYLEKNNLFENMKEFDIFISAYRDNGKLPSSFFQNYQISTYEVTDGDFESTEFPFISIKIHDDLVKRIIIHPKGKFTGK